MHAVIRAEIDREKNELATLIICWFKSTRNAFGFLAITNVYHLWTTIQMHHIDA
jgi:hypothetical protein